MSDLISRQGVIEVLSQYPFEKVVNCISIIEEFPSAQPEHLVKESGNLVNNLVNDCISRQAAIDAVAEGLKRTFVEYRDVAEKMLNKVPSAQPEPLSDAYTKAVWTWLLDYQINVAKLKGRYTPYEVLSWVANDWRKEHE